MATQCRWSADQQVTDMVIHLVGELDFTNARDIQHAIGHGVADAVYDTLVFDLTSVTFIDRYGLGMLFTYRRTHAGERMNVRVSMDSQPHRIMKMGGFYLFFNVEFVADDPLTNGDVAPV